MKTLFLLLGLGFSFGSTAQSPFKPFSPSISVGLGTSFLLNEKESFGSGSGFVFLINYAASFSLGIYKGIGLAAGIRGGRFLAPNLPAGYNSRPFFSSGESAYKEYNAFRSSYCVLTYDFILRLRKKPLSGISLIIHPGIGIASNRINEAYFTVDTNKPAFLYTPPTHDVTWKATNVHGLTTQLSSILSISFSPQCSIWLGPTIWTLPGNQKTFVGADVQLGFCFGSF